VLRSYTEADFEMLFMTRSDPDSVRWEYFEPQTEEEVRATLTRRIADTSILAQGDAIALAAVLRTTGEPIGDLVLRLVSAEHALGEIGYAVHRAHVGQGYATEAARELLPIAFDGVGMHRVIGRLEARNDASARLLEKLGMRREAHLIENEWVKGEWQSELVYAILADEWRAAVG
jgi:RimJ/RimL family protein N-acetyltransferase